MTMEYFNLESTIENFNNGIIPQKEGYISLLTLEAFYKAKWREYIQKLEAYQNHVSDLLEKDCRVRVNSLHIQICWNSVFDFNNVDEIHNGLHILNFSFSGIIECQHLVCGKGWQKNQNYQEILENDVETLEFRKYINYFMKVYSKHLITFNSNYGLNLQLSFLNNMFKILLSDVQFNEHNPYPESFMELDCESYAKTFYKFYYLKDLLNNTQEVDISDLGKEIINEEMIGKLYTSTTVDISTLPKRLQDEIRNFAVVHNLGLEEEKAREIKSLQVMQIDRIKKAYEYFKMATELLNSAKTDLSFEKIVLEDNKIFFKNNGLPNEKGYIEIEDFFKNNMILRMLDLSKVDLTNVDIRGIDFSGTNIHIDPQTIYQKDMTNVNCYGVKFSPFSDSFQDVILDGTIINDREANIDLSKVKSYNEQTKILHEVIDMSYSNRVR